MFRFWYLFASFGLVCIVWVLVIWCWLCVFSFCFSWLVGGEVCVLGFCVCLFLVGWCVGFDVF